MKLVCWFLGFLLVVSGQNLSNPFLRLCTVEGPLVVQTHLRRDTPCGRTCCHSQCPQVDTGGKSSVSTMSDIHVPEGVSPWLLFTSMVRLSCLFADLLINTINSVCDQTVLVVCAGQRLGLLQNVCITLGFSVVH